MKNRKFKKIGSLAIGTALAVSCVLSPMAVAEETTMERETTTAVAQQEPAVTQNNVDETTVPNEEETTENQPMDETTVPDAAETTSPMEEETVNSALDDMPQPAGQLSKAELQAKIDEAEALIASNPECEEELIWDVESCIALAKSVINDTNAAQEEMEEAFDLLQNAMDCVTGGPEIPLLTKDDLSALISEVEPYTSMSDKFTKESFDDFISAFTNAQAVLDNPAATAEEIDDAYSELQYAYYWLETVQTADKSELYYLFWEIKESLEEIDTSWMTPESFAKLDKAYKNAEKVLNDVLAAQAEIDAALEELSTAVDAVEFTHEGWVAMAQLVIDKVQEQIFGPLMYTPESWKEYTAAKTALENIMADPNTVEEDFRAAIGEYILAANSLDINADNANKTDLSDLIDQVESVLDNSGYYTEDTLQQLKDAYNNAKKVLDDNTVTGQVVAASELELTEALEALKFTQTGAKRFLNELNSYFGEMKASGIYNQDELEYVESRIQEITALFDDFNNNYDEIESGLYEIQNMLLNMTFSLDYLYSVLDDELAFCEEIIAANQDYDMDERTYYYYDYFLRVYREIAAIRDSGYENEDYDKLIEYALELNTIFGKFSGMRDEAEKLLIDAKDAVANADKYTAESLAAVKTAIPALESALAKDLTVVLELRFAYVDMNEALKGLALYSQEPVTKPVEETTTQKPTEKPSMGSSDNPKTGDDRNLLPSGLTAVASMAVMGVTVLLKKKKTDETA